MVEPHHVAGRVLWLKSAITNNLRCLVSLFLFYLGFLRQQKPCRNEVLPNSRGLPALPNELYSEILSHLQAIPIPQSAYLKDRIDPRRQFTLLALCQTCASLRFFFLQYAWERIEVFEGMWTLTGRLATEIDLLRLAAHMREPFHAKFAEEIRRQFETVRRNPELRQYVHVVNIHFVNSSHESIMLPQLAKILSLLPQVHTLQISSAKYDHMSVAEFSQYPQIHTLCLRHSIFNDAILLACPNLTSFTQYDPGIISLQSLLRSCSNQLQTLGLLSSHLELQEVASSFPHLRDVTVVLDGVVPQMHEENLSPLSSLPLHTLRLCLTDVQDFKKPFPNVSPADRERWIGLAKRILQKCPTYGSEVVQKRVIVITNGRSVESFPV